MKSKLAGKLFNSERFAGDLPVNDMGEHRTSKQTARRESVAPKIVICPPIEDMPEPVAQPRGGRLLKALSRRLSRRTADSDSVESNLSSSSNESVSGDQTRSENRSSCTASDSGSDGSEPRRRHRSIVSLRRVFQSYSLSSRSHSSSPTERTRKKQQQPQRILRPPVTYTYVRGLSGLPTQRVPRHTVCCSALGLNR